MNPDEHLVRRRRFRDTKYFRSVEQAVYLPRIRTGFTSVEGFVGLAQTILQSRKSRSGNSLELHAREIFIEEGLRSLQEFQHKPIIENGKRPDFLFPSQSAYEDPAFPVSPTADARRQDHMQRSVAAGHHEADRMRPKHFLTLQEGVSEGQFREMQEAGIQLVVPAGLHDAFPDTVRPHLMSLESFIADIRLASLVHEQFSDTP